jgi:hypothetical protein
MSGASVNVAVGAKIGWMIMTNIHTLEVHEQTLMFVQDAQQTVDAIFGKMIKALRLLRGALNEEVGDRHNEIKVLQHEFLRARSRLEFLNEMIRAANSQRKDLWDLLPQGELRLLVAKNENGTQTAIMQVSRRFARVNCTELRLFELYDGRMVAVA